MSKPPVNEPLTELFNIIIEPYLNLILGVAAACIAIGIAIGVIIMKVVFH